MALPQIQYAEVTPETDVKLNHTEAQCRADAAREAEAGDPDQSVGLPAPELTTEQVCNIGFAVLRAHNDDRLWRALTYDSGPYDLTTPNLALRDLGRAFYAAGLADEVRRQRAGQKALAELAAKTGELIAHLQKTGRLAPCFNLPALDAARKVLEAPHG